MSLPGKEIDRLFDAFGPVRIFDDGNKRYLAFGDSDEQSCMLKQTPLVPQHDYVRAMLLSLLFCEPKRVLCLGLGAGVLNHCLHHNYPQLKQQVVELRPAVIEAAHKHFQLPRSKRLKITNQDANDYLKTLGKKVDLLFSDLYGSEGVDENQVSESFIDNCLPHLKSSGWLVLNCWREHRAGDIQQLLQQRFQQVYSTSTPSGNWVLFASQQMIEQSANQQKNKAKQLSQQLGFSLGSYYNRLNR